MSEKRTLIEELNKAADSDEKECGFAYILLRAAARELTSLESLNAQLQAEVERTFQVLESCGIPKERAKSIANGIMVLQQRMTRENDALRQQNAQLQRDLEGYAGWAPDQFLRYQEEHKKLQKSYRQQDTELVTLRRQVTRLREALSGCVTRGHHDTCQHRLETGFLPCNCGYDQAKDALKE